MFSGLEVGRCFLQGRCLQLLSGCYIEGKGGDMTREQSRFANRTPQATRQFVLTLLQREVRTGPLQFSRGQKTVRFGQRLLTHQSWGPSLGQQFECPQSMFCGRTHRLSPLRGETRREAWPGIGRGRGAGGNRKTMRRIPRSPLWQQE